MPLVKPPRDLKTVRCVRKYKDKNGETKYNLRVLFNYVSLFTYLDLLICTFNLKADPEWNLTREDVLNTKELFKIYDTDNDGVITFLQVKSAMKVLGHRYQGRCQGSLLGMIFNLSDDLLLLKIREFSTDKKNNSMEFNEFLKMIGNIKNKTSVTQSDLMEAFR